MLGDGASRLSLTPSNFQMDSRMDCAPTGDRNMRQLPHNLPIQTFGTGYPVPMGTSYSEMELTMNLYSGSDVMTRTSDPLPNQPAAYQVNYNWKSANSPTNIDHIYYRVFMVEETMRQAKDRNSTDNNIEPRRTTRSGSFRD